mmetsp:Transcript_10417/g.29687  ORF Transcript_10417/g.29687 Transcript_10417/m.29687 type:complete len:325 (-) Transcript_10417:82-1056(-)
MTLWLFQHVACFSEPYVRVFVAQRASAAYVFHLLCAVAVVLIPLWLAFASDNFWVKSGLYHEQPRVHFAHEVFVVAAATGPGDAVGWTSRAGLEALLPSAVRVPVVRSLPLDSNRDGVADALQLVVEMPKENSTAGFRQLILLAVYSVEFRERVRQRFSALAALDASCPFVASGVWVRGQFRFRQGGPLRLSTEVRDVYAVSPFEVRWSSNWLTRNTPLTLRALLGRYAERNETMVLDLSAPPMCDYAPRDAFRAEVTLDIPPQPVHYVPGSIEVLKFAWVQVLSLSVPVWLALHAVKSFAFNHQIVETFVVHGLPSQPMAAGT